MAEDRGQKHKRGTSMSLLCRLKQTEKYPPKLPYVKFSRFQEEQRRALDSMGLPKYASDLLMGFSVYL